VFCLFSHGLAILPQADLICSYDYALVRLERSKNTRLNDAAGEVVTGVKGITSSSNRDVGNVVRCF
jgi:hypothetical protein